MSRGKLLSNAEAERVREALRQVVAKFHNQGDAAAELGMSQQSVSHVIGGGTPGFNTARAVSKYLGVSFESLIAIDNVDLPGVESLNPDRNKGRTANKIRSLRKSLGLTQEQLSARSGITRVDISRIESGHNQATSHRVRTSLAAGFGVTVVDMDSFLDNQISSGEMSKRAAKPCLSETADRSVEAEAPVASWNRLRTMRTARGGFYVERLDNGEWRQLRAGEIEPDVFGILFAMSERIVELEAQLSERS